MKSGMNCQDRLIYADRWLGENAMDSCEELCKQTTNARGTLRHTLVFRRKSKNVLGGKKVQSTFYLESYITMLNTLYIGRNNIL